MPCPRSPNKSRPAKTKKPSGTERLLVLALWGRAYHPTERTEYRTTIAAVTIRMPSKTVMTILNEIVSETLSTLESDIDQVAVAAARDMPPTQSLIQALNAPGGFQVIAEFKRKSPSGGEIRPGSTPKEVVLAYESAGAAAISCLTNRPFFGGTLDDLKAVKAEVSIPVLRKDFVVDPRQLYEARGAGADAVLLIAECLPGQSLGDLVGEALNLGLDILLEIHDQDQLPRALAWTEQYPEHVRLGINNRDLRTMKTDLSHIENLLPQLPDPAVVVAESGLREQKDIARMQQSGIRNGLIGEHLMRQTDPGQALEALLAGS